MTGSRRLDRVRGGVVAEVLLLFGGAAAGIFEFGLRPRQAVEQGVALGLQLLQFCSGPEASAAAVPLAAVSEEILIAVRGRKFVFEIKPCHFRFRFSV